MRIFFFVQAGVLAALCALNVGLGVAYGAAPGNIGLAVLFGSLSLICLVVAATL